MDWILDNIRVIFFVGVIIAYWINQNRKGWTEANDNETRDLQPEVRDSLPPEMQDNDARVREIQAEIRRKIAERRAAASGQRRPTEQPVANYREEPAPPPLPVAEPASRTKQTASPYAIEEHERALHWQERLVEQLAEAERAKAAAKAKLDSVWDRPSVAAAKRNAAHRLPHTLSVRETIRNRKALRHAWLVREVLDTPVGLR